MQVRRAAPGLSPLLIIADSRNTVLVGSPGITVSEFRLGVGLDVTLQGLPRLVLILDPFASSTDGKQPPSALPPHRVLLAV